MPVESEKIDPIPVRQMGITEIILNGKLGILS